jgi:hypothetical protein
MGGGGGAGAVSWPEYAEEMHNHYLSGHVEGSLAQQYLGANKHINYLTDQAIGNSVYTGITAYDPDSNITAMMNALTAFSDIVDAIDFSTELATISNIFSSVPSDSATLNTATLETSPLDEVTFDADQVDEEVEAYSDLLEDEVDRNLTQLRLGMLNIGAVHSSAFTVGESILRAFKAKDVAKYSSELRLKIMLQQDEHNYQLLRMKREQDANFKSERDKIDAEFKNVKNRLDMAHKIARLQAAIQLVVSPPNFHFKQGEIAGELTRLTIEANRIAAVMKKEELDEQLQIDEQDARWDLESWRYAANMLGAFSGGAGVGGGSKRPSKTASAIGGAISGAAAGSAVNVPYGTAVGAIAGGIAGALM